MWPIVVSLVLTIATLAGMTFVIFSGSFLTVDGLFFTLILASMSAIFTFNSFHALRRLHARSVSAQQVKPAPAVQQDVANAVKPSGSERVSGSAQPGAGATPAPASGRASPVPPGGPAAQASRPSPQKRRSVEGLSTGFVFVRNGISVHGAVFTQQHGQWKLVECESAAALERHLSNSGLTIFYPVGAIEGSAWAFARKRAVSRALGSVLSTVEAQGRNAVEIAHIGAANFLGLHHVTVIAHVRHIQKAALFLEPADSAHSLPQLQSLPEMNRRERAA